MGICHGETFLSWSLVAGARVFLPVTASLQRKVLFGLSLSSAPQTNQPLPPQQLRDKGLGNALQAEPLARGTTKAPGTQSVAAAVPALLCG